jgi:elongator complex protein 1
VCPRALALTATRTFLDRHEYSKAFTLCRKHRIDLNVLHDHNPKDFMDHIPLFCEHVNVKEHLNLFISSLKDEDVTTTMYTGIGASQVTKNVIVGKVNALCQALRAHLDTLSSSSVCLEPILTTHVKQQPADVEGALQRIATLRTQGKQAEAESAVKYVVLLVPVDTLYDVALGMYDFGLVLAVAQRSQKDPREYLPFLNELRGYETHYQRYRIDDYLKRFAKALVHLSRAGRLLCLCFRISL